MSLDHHARPARWLAAAIAALPLLALVVSSLAATRAPLRDPHGSFRGECGLCHGSESWKPARIGRGFDHAKFGFPLAGAHAAARCTACHASLDFARAERLCASCHEDPHRGEMGPDCARCHGARSFHRSRRDGPLPPAHALPLSGSHRQIECESCHPPGEQGHLRFAGARAECDACHLEDYRAARDPITRPAASPPNAARAIRRCAGRARPSTTPAPPSRSPAPIAPRRARAATATASIPGRAATATRATAPITTPPPLPPTPPRASAPVRHLSRDHVVGRRRVRSRSHRLPAHRRALRDALRELPRRRRVPGTEHRLLLLPSRRL